GGQQWPSLPRPVSTSVDTWCVGRSADTARVGACATGDMLHSGLIFRRAIWIVLDSVGIGEMPDAGAYGDIGSDTLGNIARKRSLSLPNLCRLGLANIKPLAGVSPAASPTSAFGQCALASPGTQTTT